MVYDRYAETVYSVLRRILGDAGAAEDALQEVFYQLWSVASRFEPQRGSLRSWLLVMARNRAISLIRKRPNVVFEQAELLRASSVVPQDMAAAQNELLARIRANLSQLPEEQRQAFEFAYFEGMTHSEIAERTQQPLGTVKTRLRTALDSLRRAFQS